MRAIKLREEVGHSVGLAYVEQPELGFSRNLERGRSVELCWYSRSIHQHFVWRLWSVPGGLCTFSIRFSVRRLLSVHAGRH